MLPPSELALDEEPSLPPSEEDTSLVVPTEPSVCSEGEDDVSSSLVSFGPPPSLPVGEGGFVLGPGVEGVDDWVGLELGLGVEFELEVEVVGLAPPSPVSLVDESSEQPVDRASAPRHTRVGSCNQRRCLPMVWSTRTDIVVLSLFFANLATGVKPRLHARPLRAPETGGLCTKKNRGVRASLESFEEPGIHHTVVLHSSVARGRNAQVMAFEFIRRAFSFAVLSPA